MPVRRVGVCGMPEFPYNIGSNFPEAYGLTSDNNNNNNLH